MPDLKRHKNSQFPLKQMGGQGVHFAGNIQYLPGVNPKLTFLTSSSN